MDKVGEVPTICFDYCFLRDHPGGESVLVMVGLEKRSKMKLAHVMPFKGGGVDWFEPREFALDHLGKADDVDMLLEL